MNTRRQRLCWCLLAIGLLLVSATAIGVAVGGGTSHPAETVASQNPVPEIQSTPETDATVTRIDVAPDGTAQWELTIRMALDSEESSEEFAAFEREFEANKSQYLDRFRDRMTGVVENAETATSREMTAENFDAETGVQEVPRRWGYVSYYFQWTGFAPTSDGTVTAGDVFRGGLFLEVEDILIITTPADHNVRRIDPDPDVRSDGELQWNGPASFDNERPLVEFATNGTQTTDGDGTQPADDDQPSETGDGLVSVVVALGGIALVVLGVTLAYTQLKESRNGSTDSPDESTAMSSPQDGAESGQAKSSTVGAADTAELATDEDRVVALLESEDGRMRQTEIADRLDWSPSKTSRVLSKMADSDEIEKLRIGRENVIDLPDENES